MSSKLSKFEDDIALIKSCIRIQSRGLEITTEVPLSENTENVKINRDLKVPLIESFNVFTDPSDFINLLMEGWTFLDIPKSRDVVSFPHASSRERRSTGLTIFNHGQ